jgi:hypothetical protein
METNTVVISLETYNRLRDYKKAHQGKLVPLTQYSSNRTEAITTYVEQNEANKYLFDSIESLKKVFDSAKESHKVQYTNYESKLVNLNIELRSTNNKLANSQLEQTHILKEFNEMSLWKFWNWKRNITK